MPKNQRSQRPPQKTPADFLSSLPLWLQTALFGLLALFVAVTPLLYDGAVPEVAGDIRWTASHLTALMGFVFLSLGALIVQYRPCLSLPPVAVAVLGLGLCIIISTIDTISPIRSLQSVQHWLSYIALFFLFFWARKTRFQHIVLWLLSVGLLLNVTLGIIQYHDLTDAKLNAIFPLWPQTFNIVNIIKGIFLQSAVPGATFANKNLAASYTVILWPLVAYLAFVSPRRAQKIMCSVILSLAFIFLFYSRSRASWIAAMGALILGIIYLMLSPTCLKGAKACIKRPLTWLILVFMLCAVTYFGTKPSPLNAYGINRNAIYQLSTLTRFDSAEFGPRLAYNLNGLNIVQDHPFNGTGIGTFHTIYPKYHNAYYTTPRHGYNVAARPQRTHNDVMQMLIEIGLIGGALFASLWFFAAYMSWRICRITAPNLTHQPALALFLFTSITGMCLNSLADFPLQMPTAPALLFALLGMLTSLYVQIYPPKVRFNLPISIKYMRPFWLVMTLALCALLYVVAQNNIAYRNGAKHLKLAMQRMQVGVIDTTTIKHINNSYAHYPYNPRLLEFRAIAFQNFQGTPPIPRPQKLAATNDALNHDPFAANHRINLANMHIKQALFARKLGDNKAFKTRLNKAKAEHSILLNVAPFSHFTYGIEGTIALLEDKKDKATTAFKRALQIQPRYTPARQGLSQLGVKP